MLNELIREIPISRVSEKYQVSNHRLSLDLPLPFLNRSLPFARPFHYPSLAFRRRSFKRPLPVLPFRSPSTALPPPFQVPRGHLQQLQTQAAQFAKVSVTIPNRRVYLSQGYESIEELDKLIAVPVGIACI